MKWNWQLKEWPNFQYDQKKIEELEIEYLKKAYLYEGAYLHFSDEEKKQFAIGILSGEAFFTSEIEGEILDRSSVQRSIRINFGLEASDKHISPAERGIADLMKILYENYDLQLTHQELFKWHSLLMQGRQDIKTVGMYRTHLEPMQIISGPVHNLRVHFEAVPSQRVIAEMDGFLKYFNNNLKSTGTKHILLVASIIHLYFESIHPFEDGNGRIGRALVIKALSQISNRPILISLSDVIQKNKKQYYNALASTNNTLDVTEWVLYFSKVILEALDCSFIYLKFLISKVRFFSEFNVKLNSRQTKVLLRVFDAGPNGFVGGVSAENYIRISGTSRATATRDLQDLLVIGAIKKEGNLKGTRYYLNI